MPKKARITARRIYDAYPDSDLLALQKPTAKTTLRQFAEQLSDPQYCGDTLFLFLVREACDAGDPVEFFNMVERASDDLHRFQLNIEQHYDWETQTWEK